MGFMPSMWPALCTGALAIINPGHARRVERVGREETSFLDSHRVDELRMSCDQRPAHRPHDFAASGHARVHGEFEHKLKFGRGLLDGIKKKKKKKKKVLALIPLL